MERTRVLEVVQQLLLMVKRKRHILVSMSTPISLNKSKTTLNYNYKNNQ